jgi:quercetin dioxygenase-like cupin family protein
MALRHLWTIPTAAGALMLTATTPASATPVTGVDSRLVTQSSANGTDFIVRDITIGPGGSTGWHWHDGTLLGAVKQGTLTHYASDCSVDGVYSAGDTVVEPSGANHIHVGRNLGTEPVVLEVLYVNPVGKPLAEDAPNPGCPFA